MREMFSLDEIVNAVNGRIVNRGASISGTVYVSGVSKDTRTIEEGNLYIALKGENFDGHDFCQKALENGASLLLVSDESKIPENSISIVVDDTLTALGNLARHYRFKIGAKVVAVTGSVGKTSTREMIAGTLSASKRVYSTKRNENNEIGLPMTILSAPSDTEVFVLEMGMRLRGEISYLTNIACPDIAVITNVGYCHIERLGSREEIRLAKMEIVEGLVNGGILVVNGDDKFLYDYAISQIPADRLLASVSIDREEQERNGLKCPFYCGAENIRFGNGIDFDVRGNIINEVERFDDVHLNLSGIHNVRNALFAMMCSKLLGASMDKAITALSEISQMNGRGAVNYGENLTVINDAYNAAPESMMAAFFNLNVVGKGKRKIAVLGGMLELGDYAPMLHEETGKDCGKYDFDHIFVTGDQKDDFVKGLLSVNPDAKYTLCDDSEDTYKKFLAYCRKGDAVLFKASNAFGFQKLANQALEEVNINE